MRCQVSIVFEWGRYSSRLASAQSMGRLGSSLAGDSSLFLFILAVGRGYGGRNRLLVREALCPAFIKFILRMVTILSSLFRGVYKKARFIGVFVTTFRLALNHTSRLSYELSLCHELS